MKMNLMKPLSIALSSALLATSSLFSLSLVNAQTTGSMYTATRNSIEYRADSKDAVSNANEPAFSLTSETNSWGTGFTTTLSLNSLMTDSISDWTLTLHNVSFTIDSIWCATAEKSGDSYEFHNMGWNSQINASSSVSFGISASGTLPETFDFTVAYTKNGQVYTFSNQANTPVTVASKVPSNPPSASPSAAPSKTPSSPQPSALPSVKPSSMPSPVPSVKPSLSPTTPSPVPSLIPAPISRFLHSTPSTGNVKALMIVVDFPDVTYRNRMSLADIQNTLFGTGNSNAYPFDSAASFFKRASYGNLNLSGDVYSYTAKYSRSYYKNKNEYETLMMEVLKGLDSTINYADYDSDKDGYIDHVAINVPLAGNSDDDFFYGCTSTWYRNPNFTVDGKRVRKFIMDDAQPSYNNIAYYNKVFCHESGHMMGLCDYYKYNTKNDWEAMHGISGNELMDDMDGDLSSYSKILLGWLNPSQIQVFTGASSTQTFSLSSCGTKGSCIILPIGNLDSNYLSEYFLIEYVGNDGNNKGYVGRGGVRILHINSTAFQDYYTGNMTFRYENYSPYYDTSDNGARLVSLVNDNKGFYQSGATISYGTSNFAGHDKNGQATVNTGYTVSIGSLANGNYSITVKK